MWRFFKFLIFSIVIVSLSFGIYKFSDRYDLKLINKEIDWSVESKNLKGAVSFDFDRDSNLYIAFKDKIKVIDKNNKENVIFYNKDLNIYDIVCYDNDIIIASDNRVIMYDTVKKEFNEIIRDLPNNGLNYKTNIILNEDNLYVSIGSNTNSGVVDEDNKIEDKASFEWVSTGIEYGNNYGFAEYGKYIREGEHIKESILSSASILEYNLNTGKLVTYATGVRNVEGFAINTKGELISIVGGMEDVGKRPVKDDADYIYYIKEKAWYGWPDFSGGDPITSPRFSDGTNKLFFLIANHPTEVPLGPKYQHDKLGALKGLTIDREGKCFPKDTIIFGDNIDNCIYILVENSTPRIISTLDKKSYIEKIRYNNSSVYILDSKGGCLYKIQGDVNKNLVELPNIIWIFIIIFTISIIMTLLYKIKVNKNKI